MKKNCFCKNLLTITVILTINIHGVQAQLKPKVDERIELTSIINRLAGHWEYSSNDFSSYVEDVDKYFAAFKDHPVITFMKKLRNERGVSFDAIPSIATRLNPAPLLTPRFDFIKSEIDSRWTQEDAEKFSTLLQQFYAETNCKKFFQAHKEMYRIAEKRMAKMLSKINFKWYKEFFGEQPDGKFNLIISLLNGGSNYNSTVMLPSGKEDLFAIIGTWKTDKKGLPVYDESFLSTVIHEFGHSYSNRIVLANMDKLLQSGDKIYPDVKDDLHKVGYGSSKTMLIESILRACVIKYLKKNPTPGVDLAFEIAWNENGGFLWTENLTSLLDEYEKTRKRYPTLREFMPRVISFFDSLPGQISILRKSFAAKSPYVVRVSPIDEKSGEIRITFNKKMFNHKDFGLIDAAYPPMDTSYFEDDMLTLVCRLKLKSKVAYGFYLPFYQFRSADGYRMAQNQLIYFTTTGYTALPPVDNYGYRIEKESVIFSYKIPPNFSGEITTVAVAGNFNSWNPSTEGFQLKKISSDLYELSVAKKVIGKQGERKMFKFVINGDKWIEPLPQKAKNVIKDNDYHNLYLEL